MPVLFWIVPFIIAGGIMWFVANQTAPFGREIPLSRAIVAIIVMGVFNSASNHWLKPIIGDWCQAVSFIADTVAVMATLQLSFWRSLLAVFIYFVVIFIAILAIALIARSGKPSPGARRTAVIPPLNRAITAIGLLIPLRFNNFPNLLAVPESVLDCFANKRIIASSKR